MRKEKSVFFKNIIFLLFIFPLYAFEIDIDSLKENIKNNPENIPQKILLARSYISHSDFSEAKKLIDEVLGLDANHKFALSLFEDIKKLQDIEIKTEGQKLSNSQKLASYFDKLYVNKNYKDIIFIHELLKKNNIPSLLSVDTDAINSYIDIKEYDRALDAIENTFYSLEEEKYLKRKISQEREKDFILKRRVILEKNYQISGSFETLKEYFFLLKDSGEIDKSLSLILDYNEKYSQNEESILFIANNLYWNQKTQESLSVLKQVVDETDNSDILTLYKNILVEEKRADEAVDAKILQKAVFYHKKRNYKKALKKYKSYYKRTKDLNTAKEIAEIYFFQNKAEKSLPYYKAYLSKNSKDYRVRFRYASALDKMKLYRESESHYKKIASKNMDISDLSLYRYANSLMRQQDEQKWNKSKIILLKLQEKLQFEDYSKEREELLKHTENALEKVSKPMQKPTKHKDIMLTEGKKKIFIKKGVFSDIKMQKREILSVQSLLKTTDNSYITLSAYMLEDDHVKNSSYGVSINNITKIKQGQLSLEMQKSTFKTGEEAHKEIYKSIGFLTHYDFQDFRASIGINKFEFFIDPNIELSYKKIISIHDMRFGVKYINGAFVNNRASMIENRVGTLQLSFYDAILLPNLEQAEISLKINNFDDKNSYFFSWINLPLYKKIFENFENSLDFSGSYEYNTKTDTDYNPVRFFDGNFMQMKVKKYFGQRGFVQGVLSLGYSFENSDFLYNYGLIAQIPIVQNFNIRIDCRHYQSGYSPNGANECYAAFGYTW